MDRKEVLDILTSFNEQLNKMTEEELYNHMMETSSSFRKTVSELDKLIAENEREGTSITGSSVAVTKVVVVRPEKEIKEIKNLLNTAKIETDIESTSAYIHYYVSCKEDKSFEIPAKPRKEDKVWAMAA